jgi:hypothetical protein
MRRRVAALAALAGTVVIALSGCAATLPAGALPPGSVGLVADDTDPPTTTPPPGGTPTDGQDPGRRDGPDDVLFQVDPAPSFLVPLIAAFAAPTVTVYRDGTVVRQAPDDGRPGRPPVLLTGRADRVRLAAFVAELGAWDEPEGRFAYGIPDVTDQPTTRVVVHAPDTAATVDVVGFQPSLDRYVDEAARANRAALRALVDQASALLPDGEPYVPDAVRVVDVGASGPDAGAPEWTGPPPEDFGPGRFLGLGCAVLLDPGGERYRAALANPSSVWITPSGPRTIAVTPLLPGQPSCS